MALEPSIDLGETTRSLTAQMETSIKESFILLERVRHSIAHSEEMLARSHEQMSAWREGVARRPAQDLP